MKFVAEVLIAMTTGRFEPALRCYPMNDSNKRSLSSV
jgi:hypothetical protein